MSCIALSLRSGRLHIIRHFLQNSTESKGRLDASDIVFEPVALGNIFLADWHTRPVDAHDSHTVNVVLVKLNDLLGVVTGRPLVQSPCLDDLLGLLQLDILSRDVAVKQLPLATLLGALKFLRGGTSEGGEALRVGEGQVELFSSSPELFLVRNGSRVNDASRVLLGAGISARLGGGTGGTVNFGCGKSARGVGARSMLDILAVLSDQGRGKLEELLAELGHKLGPDEILHDLLLLGLGVDVNVKDKFVLFRIVSDLWNGDGTRDILDIGGST